MADCWRDLRLGVPRRLRSSPSTPHEPILTLALQPIRADTVLSRRRRSAARSRPLPISDGSARVGFCSTARPIQRRGNVLVPAFTLNGVERSTTLHSLRARESHELTLTGHGDAGA